MLDWIEANQAALGIALQLGTLLVWLLYLHLFLIGYRRQRRARILINHGVERGIGARCFVSNMSAEPIYVQSIIGSVFGSDFACSSAVTDLDEVERQVLPQDERPRTRQGPLLTGQVADLGTFNSLIQHVLENRIEEPKDLGHLIKRVERVKIQVIAVYGSEDLLCGASREFRLSQVAGKPVLQAMSPNTEQIRSYRRRLGMTALIAEDDL